MVVPPSSLKLKNILRVSLTMPLTSLTSPMMDSLTSGNNTKSIMSLFVHPGKTFLSVGSVNVERLRLTLSLNCEILKGLKKLSCARFSLSLKGRVSYD